MEEVEVGRVADYFAKIGVAGIELTKGNLSVGDTIHIKGYTTDLTQKVGSMQVEHDQVEKADQGTLIGIKVEGRVRSHDTVYKVNE